MKFYFLPVLLYLSSCADNSLMKDKEMGASSTSFETNDTVSLRRETVAKKPVASYIVPINDPKLNQTFGVEVYETPQTFQYLLRMHYESMQATDTLKVPNFGVLPVIKIIKGKDRHSCIIGFLDNKKEFKEYKMLTAKGNQMRLIVLKKYTTGRYRNVY